MTINLEIGLALIASLGMSVAGVVIAIKVSLAKIEAKLQEYESLPKRLAVVEQKIAARDEELKEIHRRLNSIDSIKIEAEFATLKASLENIKLLVLDVQKSLMKK
jgi:hypothetical protein